MPYPQRRSPAPLGYRASAALAFLLTVVCLSASTTPAAANTDGVAINGTYLAVSDGQWAQTNAVYHDEATLVSTWTITSSCSDYLACWGTVTSDQGWSAPIRYLSRLWLVTRVLPDWEHCTDGTTAPGEQKFTFSPDDAATLTGWDRTMGPSGACGINHWLTIDMPFKLTRKQ